MATNIIIANSGQRLIVKPGANNSIEVSIQSADKIYLQSITLDYNAASVAGKALETEAERMQENYWSGQRLSLEPGLQGVAAQIVGGK